MTTNFDQKVNRLETHCKNWDYIGDGFGKSGLLPFSIADMDFPAPPQMVEALKNRVEHGIYGYTKWEQDDFRGAIIRWFKQRFETDIPEEFIAYSPAVIYSISKLIEVLTDIGDHVVLQTPAYDGLLEVIEYSGRILSSNELKSNNGYYVTDYEDLEEKLSHPKAKIFLLCSPQNPSGRVWRKDELEKMLELCEKHDVFVISDEVHMDLLRSSQEHLPLVKVASNLDRVCICTSGNKTFNTPGLIGSYVIIPNDEVRGKFAHATRQAQGFYSISIMAMTALITAYTSCEEWVNELNEYIDGNMQTVAEFLKEQVPEIKFTIPESTYLAWFDVKDLPYSAEEIQDALVNVGNVAINSGEKYGKGGAGHLRMNVGCPRAKVLEGLEGLKKAIDHLNSGSN